MDDRRGPAQCADGMGTDEVANLLQRDRQILTDSLEELLPAEPVRAMDRSVD
jgi:hypothetical protein